MPELKVITEKEAAISALQIVNPGACNPIGVARTVHQMCLSAQHGWVDGPDALFKGHDYVSGHPAIKLATYQLAFLMGMEPYSRSTEYSKWQDRCREIAGADLPEYLRPPGWAPPVDEAANAEGTHNLASL